MNKSERRSLKKYGEIADSYDESFDGRFTAKFKEKILEVVGVEDGERVLDFGCGNGSLIYEIKKLAKIDAYGIDISPEMIAECKRRDAGINFSVASGSTIDFEDGFLMLWWCAVFFIIWRILWDSLEK